MKIEPCPFCGGKAVLEPWKDCFRVSCTHCAAAVQSAEFSAEAIEAWNRRASPWRDVKTDPLTEAVILRGDEVFLTSDGLIYAGCYHVPGSGWWSPAKGYLHQPSHWMLPPPLPEDA